MVVTDTDPLIPSAGSGRRYLGSPEPPIIAESPVAIDLLGDELHRSEGDCKHMLIPFFTFRHIFLGGS